MESKKLSVEEVIIDSRSRLRFYLEDSPNDSVLFVTYTREQELIKYSWLPDSTLSVEDHVALIKKFYEGLNFSIEKISSPDINESPFGISLFTAGSSKVATTQNISMDCLNDSSLDEFMKAYIDKDKLFRIVVNSLGASLDLTLDIVWRTQLGSYSVTTQGAIEEQVLDLVIGTNKVYFNREKVNREIKKRIS